MELPRTNQSYKPLFDLFTSFLKCGIMFTGLELRFFDGLENPVSAPDLAREMNLDPLNAARFLDALAVAGLIDKKQGLYRNRELAQTFLTSHSPTYVGDLLSIYHEMCAGDHKQMADLVRRGPSARPPKEEHGSADLWAERSRAGAQWVFGEMGEMLAGIVSSLPGFDSFEKMMDLGGGHGVFALYMVEAHPSMSGVVFDRPAVLKTAEELSRRFGLDHRIETRPGDYLVDDLGEGYDLVFACSTLNFAKERIDELMTKVRRSLKPGGYFLTLQDGMTHERTRPDTMLGHLIDSLQTEGDFMFDQGFLAEAMLRAGFRQVRSRTIDAPVGRLDLDCGRL